MDAKTLKYTIRVLKKHIEHPTKPGYQRHDIVDEIKSLTKKLEKVNKKELKDWNKYAD